MVRPGDDEAAFYHSGHVEPYLRDGASFTSSARLTFDFSHSSLKSSGTALILTPAKTTARPATDGTSSRRAKHQRKVNRRKGDTT